MLAHQYPLPAFPAPLATDAVIRQARQRGLVRMLQALFREGLLQSGQLVREGAVSWLPLWSSQALLRFDGLEIGRTGHCRLAGTVTHYQNGRHGEPILTAAVLLHRIARALPQIPADGDLWRLAGELDNSLENDILCLGYRQQWAARLNASVQGGDGFLAALRSSDLANPALLLEQWGALGHPWHPTFKAKPGLDRDEVIGMSPEFEARLELPVAAVRAGAMRVELSDDSEDYRAWFARSYPAVWRQWCAALALQVDDLQAWLPLPLHPYQAERALPARFAAEIDAGTLRLLPGVTLAAAPTMSFRTVVPDGAAALHHIKLPIALRLTSAQRTVSPKSAVMGPRLSVLLAAIIEQEQGFGQTLDILAEDVGLHYLDPQGDDDRARHLSALFRANPMSKRSAVLFPLPVAALFCESPRDGAPLVAELAARCGGALPFFERYCATVLNATLSAYLLYGIAFEAHQQNSFIMVSPGLAPVQLLLRDFGDLRIHAPTLAASGLALQVYRPGHTCYDDAEVVREKLLHAVMLCHLGELAQLLAATFHQSEAPFWDAMRSQAERVFDALRSRTHPARWVAERHAILKAPWPAKALLRMRLSDTQDDAHKQVPNPLLPGQA